MITGLCPCPTHGRCIQAATTGYRHSGSYCPPLPIRAGTNRSNCHVDAECGLSRLQLHAAKAQFADAYSRRRGLAHHRQDAGSARRPQGTGRTAMPPNTGWSIAAICSARPASCCSGPRPMSSCCSTRPSCSPRRIGWGRILGLLFPRGLMLLDFEEHRLHRRALSVAFKSGPMKSYLADARYRHRGAGGAMEGAARADAVLSRDEAAHARPRRDVVSRRRHRARGGRDHPRLRRHGGGLRRRDPQAAARHRDGARRQGPQAHRRLFLRADPDPPRQRRRRRPVLAAVPGDP